MRITMPCLVLGSLITIVAGAQAAGAQGTCSTETGHASLPRTEKVIADWEAARSVRFAPEVRARLWSDLCGAIRDISNQGAGSWQDLDAGSGEPVRAYLDDTLRAGDRFPGLASRLEAKFLLGASPRLPEQRRMAMLTFRFTRTPDRMLVGNTTWSPPSGRIVSEYGTWSYQGYRSGTRVCQGTIVINSSAGALVQC